MAGTATDTGTGTGTDPAKDKATGTDPAKDKGAANGTAAAADDDDDDAGKMDAEAWRKQARKNERDLRAAQTRLDQLEQTTKTDTEKAIEKAREEGRAEIRGEVAKVRAEAAVLSVAGTDGPNKLANPADAVTFLANELADFVQDDGKVDRKAIDAAIAKLVKDRPYLAAAGARARPLPGGGATQATGSSFNDVLRSKIRGQ